MILLEPANKITHAKVGDQAADHLSNPVSGHPKIGALIGRRVPPNLMKGTDGLGLGYRKR